MQQINPGRDSFVPVLGTAHDGEDKSIRVETHEVLGELSYDPEDMSDYEFDTKVDRRIRSNLHCGPDPTL